MLPLSKEHSNYIFKNNISLIRQCDIIIANLTPFRGACIDDGTAFEIGYGFSQGLKIYGYTTHLNKSLIEITHELFDVSKQPEFTIIENFDNHPVNLMIYESIKESGGFICETFEEVIKKISELSWK